MTQARQWWVLVRYKDEAGAGFGRQYVTATNAYEAIQMAKALYGKLLISESTDPMLTASSEPCIGTDRQVASGFRENHAFCAGRPDLLPDWSVKERLKAPARQNPVAQCHPIRQSCPQSAFSWGPSGKCRFDPWGGYGSAS